MSHQRTADHAADHAADRSPGWLRRLAGYCCPYRAHAVLTAAGVLAVTASTAAFPLLQRLFIDDTVIAHRIPAWHLAAALVAVALIGCCGLVVRRYNGCAISLAVQHDLRVAMFGAMTRLDGSQQDHLDTGQLVSSSVSDTTVVQAFLQLLPMLASNVLQLVIALGVMAVLSPLLSLVALAVVPALLLAATASGLRVFPASWHARQQAGEVTAVVERAVTGVRLVKAFGQEQRELARLEAAARRLFASRMRVVRLSARFTPTLQAIPMLGQVGVLALGGWLALHGSISVGTFFAFALYLGLIASQARALGGAVTLVQQARASVVRVLDAIDRKPLIMSPPRAKTLRPGAASIEFDGVRFGYQPSRPVLRGLSMRIAAGETVAVIGAAGSGTSTIAQLLARFYDAEAGAVRVGGHDIRELSLGSLRSAVHLVMADGFFFHGTIRDAIAFGRPGASTDEVTEAAAAAGAHEFISGFPRGYETVIGERGLTLSRGQRQRIALAQALLCDPPVLVLDDATSALDARTEARVLAGLHETARPRTTLLIAHRPATLHLADRIAVLDDGRVADIGSHDELTERCDTYRQLLTGMPQDLPEGRQDAGCPSAPEPPATGLAAMAAALPPARDVPVVRPAGLAAPHPRLTPYRLLRPLAAALLLGLALDSLDAAIGIVLPLLLRTGIDNGLIARDVSIVAVVSLVSAAIALADWLVNMAQLKVVGRMGEQALYNLRITIFSHLQRLGLDFYERERPGHLLTCMTTDVDALSSFMQSGLITLVNSMLTVTGITAVLLVVDPATGLIVLAMTPAICVAAVIFRKASRRAYGTARSLLSSLNADLQETAAGLRAVQAYRREQHSVRSFARGSAAYRATQLRGESYAALYFAFVQLGVMLAGVFVMLVAVGQIHRSALTVGGVAALLVYVNMFFAPLQQLSHVYDGYLRSSVGLRRIAELLRVPAAAPCSPRALTLAGPTRTGTRSGARIELRDVRFRYGAHEPEALTGLNLTIEPGDTVALVGQTGAGKSTVIKLIARFYDATAGSITVDGEDIRDYDLTAYRTRIGLVPQETDIFPGTVRDVIAYGRPEASDAEVADAARAAGAYNMVSRLPGGFGYEVGQGGNALSSGQRQLLALARAYLTDPAILLLDEATAALDLATERAVLAATANVAAGRTAIVVAHRLTTAERASRIAVMHDGRVIETGTPAALRAAGGAYAALWAAAHGEQANPADGVGSGNAALPRLYQGHASAQR